MCDPQESRNSFSRLLVDIITKNALQESEKPHINTVFSPASVQSCLTLAFIGSSGSTAEELRNGLHLGPGDRHHIARTFGEFWRTNCNYGDRGPILKSVNRLYVNDALELHPEFNEIAGDFFQSKAETAKFADSEGATQQINDWVEQETEHKISNLLQSDAVNDETSAVIINALYFKGKWLKPFMPEATSLDMFHMDQDSHVGVNMMYQEDKFRFADLPQLKARAVQLPYEYSNIHMLILLPNEISGLKDLELQLKDVDLADIDAAMTLEDVEIFLPRMSIEYDVDLKNILHQLGIAEVFSDKARLDGLFTSRTGQKISAARHRGYIDVNEAGSEAAAVSFMKIVPMMLNLNTKLFKVDHPFVFYIRSPQAVFFAGRFSNPKSGEEEEGASRNGSNASMYNVQERQ
ncbi:serine protease inhibitor 42Dd [Drosophila eugracilis]|uniref:serine protease inhibitor 42Dd n=1 Tax=Drosophila eugracilis TaxID=29029 RepID=UPI0007E8A7C9|nr:serine protease inhibitor 42Dd [Drosophila eugracilis]XP_041675616.1 serine protease inhibitor 42Dd [Drosophila eugracilis]